jgi:gliding motility-associated-like protein
MAESNANGELGVDHLFTDISGDSSIMLWNWNFGDGEFSEEQNPEHSFNDEGIFMVSLTVENSFGCTDTDTVEVEVAQIIVIPDVFTPDDDGFNDNFFIDNFGVIAYELTIYNRWGIVMHYDNSGEIFWDGRTPSGTEAEAGTYYYVLLVKNEFSLGNFKKTGYLTLIR